MLEWLPEDTNYGLVYLKNTVVLVVMSVIGTVLSAAIVGYGFSRLRFPGRDALFGLMIATMMLPGAVTMLPTFLIFRSIGWIDTLYPLWVSWLSWSSWSMMGNSPCRYGPNGWLYTSVKRSSTVGSGDSVA